MRTKLFLIFVLSSILLFLSWYVDSLFEPAATSAPKYIPVLIEAMKTLGSTGLALVFLNLWVETDDWKQYFEKRIKSVVIQQDYMSNLDNNTLDSVLRNLMKARFKGIIIDRENGFLEHFENYVQKYIGLPFREDVISITKYEENTEDTWKVTDKVEFTCRKIGDGIQEDVTWRVGSTDQAESIDVWITRPYGSSNAEKELNYPQIMTKMR